MTAIDRELTVEVLELPPGVEIFQDVVRGLGGLSVLSGQVLVARLDNAVIKKHTGDQTAQFGRVISSVFDRVPEGHEVFFDDVPGEQNPNIMGVWVCRAVR